MRDPVPERAVAATAAAFRAIDWNTAVLDEQLETRLFSALPPLKRCPRWPWLRRFPSSLLAGLPPAFWALPAPTRLALALRLTRGFSTEVLATALAQPPDEVRSRLLAAIALLAGDSSTELPEACRRCRLARLDDPAAERRHVIECAACQRALPRWEQAEEKLALALAQTTGALRLPHASVEALADELGRGPQAERAGARWRRPEVLQAALVLVVVFASLALILPQRNASQGARPPTTARGLLEASLGGYGAAPDGEGVVHRRYRFDLGTPAGDYIAETWTDVAQPARHRMQLSTGKQLMEWQVGDGDRKLRYVARSNQFCGTHYDNEMLALGSVNTWEINLVDQAAQRAARWSFGPWALGRRYLEQALAADTVRSLGVVTGDDGALVTLAADGRAISGTLLLKLDGATGDLREVREVRDDNGQTRSRTVWQLLDEQRIPLIEARKAAIFTGLPLDPRPREIERDHPILDPACPIVNDENIVSPAAILASGCRSVLGFAPAPPNTERVVFAGQSTQSCTYPTVTYLEPRRRLIITRLPEDLPQGEPATDRGQWRVVLEAASLGTYKGVGASRERDVFGNTDFFFMYAEGWEREELLAFAGTARLLRLTDLYLSELPIYDPDPTPAAVLEVLLSAAQNLQPRPGQTAHTVIDTWSREDPAKPQLRDPYHAESPAGSTEAWISYGAADSPIRWKAEHAGPDRRLREVEWGGERWQSYYPGPGTLRRYSGPFSHSQTQAQLDRLLPDILRRKQFEIVEDAPDVVSLQITLPITGSELDWIRQQQRGRYSRLSFATPWLADLEIETITYRTTFDNVSHQIYADVEARTQQGAILVQRTHVKRFEWAAQVAASVWEYVDPAKVHTVDVNLDRQAPWQPPIHVTNVEVATIAAPSSVWGWPANDPIQFTVALVPEPALVAVDTFQTLDGAVAAGAAVELRYSIPGVGQIKLVEGPPALLHLLLTQTPAQWTTAERRAIHIAGSDQSGWLMRDPASQRIWLIFELPGALIVFMGNTSQEQAILESIDRLRYLK